MAIHRTNETNQGVTDRSIGKGQTLRTNTGKDSSDWAGKAGDEVTAKLKMGGGIHDYSKVDPENGKGD
jgi:hypothetical protein